MSTIHNQAPRPSALGVRRARSWAKKEKDDSRDSVDSVSSGDSIILNKHSFSTGSGSHPRNPRRSSTSKKDKGGSAKRLLRRRSTLQDIINLDKCPQRTTCLDDLTIMMSVKL